MDCSNPFGAIIFSGIGDVTNGTQNPNSHMYGSGNSGESTITEVFIKFDQSSTNQRRNQSYPQPLRNDISPVPRIIHRDTDPYPYKSSHSQSASEPSSGSYLQMIPFAQPSRTDHSSESLIQLASLMETSSCHHQLTHPCATGQQLSNDDPIITQDHGYNRRQTQWYLPYQPGPTPTVHQTMAQPASNIQPPSNPDRFNPVAGCKSPNSTLTPDPIITMYQVINENNTKLYDAILKQQETMTTYLPKI